MQLKQSLKNNKIIDKKLYYKNQHKSKNDQSLPNIKKKGK
jgi:hypothetical protein